jgi:secreted Zn-dependent insulinase-like peptidase
MKEIRLNDALINNSVQNGNIKPFSFNNEENYSEQSMKRISQKNFPQICLLIIVILLLITLIIFIIIYYITSKEFINIVIPKFKKPFLDDNKYGIIKLKNGIEVLLIQDQETIKSSVTFIVNNGYLSNLTSPGVAQLTMLYLCSQSKKSLRQDLNQYFGDFSCKITRFFSSFNFYCLNDGLYDILLEFGQIFTKKINISIGDESILSEMEERYNIYNKDFNIKEDHLIKYLIEGVNVNNSEILPQGNKEMFENKKNLSEIIKQNINEGYYGNNIKIVLYSNIKLSLAKAYIIEAFNEINNINKNKTSNNINFDTSKIIYHSVENSMPILKVCYLINGTEKINENPYLNQGYLNYVNYILRSSDKDSLYNILNKNYSVRSIRTYSNITFNNKIEYFINVDFYDIGNFIKGDFIENILKIIFTYVEKNIQSNFTKNFNQKMFNYLKKDYENCFIFKDKSSDFEDYTNNQAFKLFFRESENPLFLYDNFLPETNVNETLKFLTSQFTRNNSFVIIGIENGVMLECLNQNTSIFTNKLCKYLNRRNLTTKYFNLNYSEHKVNFSILGEDINTTNYNLTNPNIFSTKYNNLVSPNILDKNEFIQKNDIHLIYDNETLKIYSKIDRTFRLPKITVNIQLFHYLSRIKDTIDLKSSKNIFSFLTYYMYLKINIEEELREAIIAGNSIYINKNNDFIHIEIICFTDVIKEILEKIVYIINNPNLTEQTKGTYFRAVVEYLNKNETDEYWKYKIKKNYYIKSKIQLNKNQIANISNEIINKVNEVNNSMITYIYFYGNINDTLAKDISQLFIEKKSIKFYLIEKLGNTYINSSINYFMDLFQNIEIPKDNYSIYYLQIEENINTTVQVLYYFEEYTNEKYIKLFLLSKMLMGNNTNIKASVQVMNGLFLLIEKTAENKDDNIEKEIDKLFSEESKKKIIKEYRKINNDTKIELFYYLKNNFFQDYNKKDLNLNDRAYQITNNLFYDNIPINNTSSNSNKFTMSDLKKLEIENIFEFLEQSLEKKFKKITISFGKNIEHVKNRSTIIFKKVHNAIPQPLIKEKNNTYI